MEKMLIILNLFGLFLISSNQVFANSELLRVYKQCKNDSGFHCDVIREVNGKKDKLASNVKEPWIEQVNNDYFKVTTTCGNPCQVTEFIGKDKKQDDGTDEFVAIDPKTNCLIYTDTTKKKILARKLKTVKSFDVVKLNAKIFNRLDLYSLASYRDFKRKSYFDDQGNLVLIFGSDEEEKFIQNFSNPCKLNINVLSSR